RFRKLTGMSVAITAAGLRDVHCGISGAEQLRGGGVPMDDQRAFRRTTTRGVRDTNACADEQQIVLEANRLAKRAKNTLSHRQDFVRLANFDQHCELVAAESRDEVGAAGGLAEAGGDRYKDGVAGSVTVLV